MNKYYTFQSIDANEMERLLIQLKELVESGTFEETEEILTCLENIKKALNYNETDNTITIDGGIYDSEG